MTKRITKTFIRNQMKTLYRDCAPIKEAARRASRAAISADRIRYEELHAVYSEMVKFTQAIAVMAWGPKDAIYNWQDVKCIPEQFIPLWEKFKDSITEK